jgi:hydrogenase-4 component E
VPIGVATVLVGYFMLVTRRRSVSQIVGLLLVDNGIALVTFLLTAGVPLIVELGATLDVLLVVVVLQVLVVNAAARNGSFDLDEMRELHD